MKQVSQLIKLLDHPLNQNRKIETLFKVIWWKINQIFFKIPAIIEMIKGARIICYPDSSYGSFVVYANLPEFEELNFIHNITSDGDCVFDVGANLGDVAILAASKGENVKVYTFEPTKELIPLIHENIAINQFQNRINVISDAVSNKNGKINFALENESEINHISYKNSKNNNTSRVNCITLDKFTKTKSIKHINLLKIDVEGAEMMVFEGSKYLFKNNKVDIIVFEVNKNILNYGYNEKKMINFLERNNFFVFEFKRNKLSLVNENFKAIETTNLVAILKNKEVIKKIKQYL